ncbi:hypothetical protein POM88_031113 [Heracleum sosnowskyi]|uniref:RNase H type-1 domain-containing protein n=1 Tax=Heracleum sosnowskyi TaxID=360622 RepID=A0AAD8HZR2_9APIA|nr:hypothetical protein POM88_031113 [Heracleum sosnowskyi]
MKFPTPTGVGHVKGCQYDSRICYNQAMKWAEKTDVLREVTDLGEQKFMEEEELPDDYFESMGIEVEPRTGALMMESSRPIMMLHVGILEEASDDEESSEQVTARLNKGKWVRKETSVLINLPIGMSREVAITLEGNIPQEAPEMFDNNGDNLIVTKTGEPSTNRNFDVDLDPRMIPLPDGVGTFEDIISILVDPNDPSKVLKIGANLGPNIIDNLISFLKENLDVFAWSHADMIEIDPEVMCRRLNLDPIKKGIRQKRRPVSGERVEALREEVDRLMEVGLIKESFYPTWLANPVLVKKPNGKWRTCVDFNDLNKACLNDSFPLPRIDQLRDATTGHALLSFMDAYSCYNQILIKGEVLVIYLAVSEYAVSAVLIREEGEAQLPVYYLSKRLVGAETRYLNMEKLVYALILASRKLRPYFQAHKFEVRTTYPLIQVLHKPETSRRMLKWVVELEILAEENQNSAPWWSLYVDGASNKDGAGAGFELVSPERCRVKRAVHFTFHATNNDAEYEALINGFKLALELKVENLNAFSDSMIVVYQKNGGYQTRGPRTELHLRCAEGMIRLFNEVNLELIHRSQNETAYELAKFGSHRETTLLGSTPLDIYRRPSVPEEELMVVEERAAWMSPLLAYIKNGALPGDKNEARRVRYMAARYAIYDGGLYKRGFNVPLLKCIDGAECNYILRGIHEGICGNHSGGSSVAKKIPRQGYYWSTLKKDDFEFARACDKYQRYTNFYNSPVASLTSLMSPWPFAMWGIDLIMELPKAKGSVKYDVVAVDYFTK